MNNAVREILTGSHDNLCRLHTSTIKEVNKVISKLQPDVLAALEGKNLTELDLPEITYTLKNNQIKSFSSYKEMQTVGIDITNQVVLSDAIKTDLDTLQNLPSVIEQGIGHIAIKEGKAVVNAYGINDLERCKIKLNKKQNDLLKLIEAIQMYCTKDLNSYHILHQIIRPEIIKDWNGNTNVDMVKFKEITYILER